jgi:hypothetical protein
MSTPIHIFFRSLFTILALDAIPKLSKSQFRYINTKKLWISDWRHIRRPRIGKQTIFNFRYEAARLYVPEKKKLSLPPQEYLNKISINLGPLRLCQNLLFN